jgi:diguanylate cyclase (GGDEF)-like protein
MTAVPFPDFAQASTAVLADLRQRLGFGLCMVTRRTGDDRIVVHADGDAYGVRAGDRSRWSDSLCAQMVDGHGPQIAPDARAVPAYAAAPDFSAHEIGAYLGVPLETPDGAVLGTLCGFDPAAKPGDIEAELPTLRLLARLLATILSAEMETDAVGRWAERAQRADETDPLTGLANRRAWALASEAEEDRCRRFGTPAAVVAVELDGLKEVNDSRGPTTGDRLLRVAASVLADRTRSGDLVARVGGGEFAVLLLDTESAAAGIVEARLRTALDEAGVRVAVGAATRSDGDGLAGAHALAQAAMRDDGRPRFTTRADR